MAPIPPPRFSPTFSLERRPLASTSEPPTVTELFLAISLDWRVSAAWDKQLGGVRKKDVVTAAEYSAAILFQRLAAEYGIGDVIQPLPLVLTSRFPSFMAPIPPPRFSPKFNLDGQPLVPTSEPPTVEELFLAIELKRRVKEAWKYSSVASNKWTLSELRNIAELYCSSDLLQVQAIPIWHRPETSSTLASKIQTLSKP